jgi:hypothetical protein
MARDYSGEPSIRAGDRQAQIKRAAKLRYRRRYALTIECDSEADQKAAFRVAQQQFKGRRIRVVVA